MGKSWAPALGLMVGVTMGDIVNVGEIVGVLVRVPVGSRVAVELKDGVTVELKVEIRVTLGVLVAVKGGEGLKVAVTV